MFYLYVMFMLHNIYSSNSHIINEKLIINRVVIKQFSLLIISGYTTMG